MDRAIEIFRRIVFVTIWIVGGGLAVIFILLNFLAFSYFCHKLLIWILAKREEA